MPSHETTFTYKLVPDPRADCCQDHEKPCSRCAEYHKAKARIERAMTRKLPALPAPRCTRGPTDAWVDSPHTRYLRRMGFEVVNLEEPPVYSTGTRRQYEIQAGRTTWESSCGCRGYYSTVRLDPWWGADLEDIITQDHPEEICSRHRRAFLPDPRWEGVGQHKFNLLPRVVEYWDPKYNRARKDPTDPLVVAAAIHERRRTWSSYRNWQAEEQAEQAHD